MSAPSLTLLADRRAREGSSEPCLEARGTMPKRTGREAMPAPRGAGLTRRERRVKEIMLKGLNAISGPTKAWAAYQERQHLVDRLDVAFIDREIAKMEHALRPQPALTGFLGLLGLAYVAFHVSSGLGQAATWWTVLDVLMALFTPVSTALAIAYSRRATRRRLWIYEALRELSDADDEGVQLGESVRLADLIVDADEASAPLHRIRTH